MKEFNYLNDLDLMTASENSEELLSSGFCRTFICKMNKQDNFY